MDNFGDDMRFEMEEVLPHSHPQTSLEHSSLDTTRIDAQCSVALPQLFPALDEGLNHSMDFGWAESHATFPPETLILSPTVYAEGSIRWPDHTSAHDFSSFQQGNVPSQSQEVPPDLNQNLNQQRPAQISTRKRASKAPTISAKNWKPHEGRIRQLYVSEGKSIQELREIMNEELGITATLRQYKVQIQKMRIERNVKAQERKSVVRHIDYRIHALGKQNSRVRIRQHEVTQEKLSRWAKENVMDQPSMSAAPLSPLPSCISIYTNSVYDTLKQASPLILKHQQLVNNFATASNMSSTLMQRLLRNAQSPKHIIESQEVRAVFNDLQLMLSNDYIPGKRGYEDNWNAAVKEDMIQVRNLMNIIQALHVGGDLKETRELLPINKIRDQISNRHAAWMTPHGRVQASFWTVTNDSNFNKRGNSTRTANRTIAARLVIVPSSIRKSPFLMVFDFTPHLDPSASISYQAMIPNHSEVFRIVTSGAVEELVDLLEKGIASLTDRDEEGRSLLNYATSAFNTDMCKFLVSKNVDVNAIEVDLGGYLRPVHYPLEFNDAEAGEIECHKKAQCIRIMLEAGADFSLEIDLGNLWWNGFEYALRCNSIEILKHILDLGEPFISPHGLTEGFGGGRYALTTLADNCGYETMDTIDVVDKAILLLNRKVDISCRDEIGDTVLHTLLKCDRFHDRVSKTRARRHGSLCHWTLSSKAPKDLLMVFITAGADVYAVNDEGKTPSVVASEYGREDEWIEALELCGYDVEEVLASSIHRPTRVQQASKLSFQEYCQQRQHLSRFEELEIGDTDDDSQSDDEDELDEVQSEGSNEDAYEEDDYGEIRLITDKMKCPVCGENMEILGKAESADDDMNIDHDRDNEGNGQTYNAEETDDHQIMGLESIEEPDVDFDDWLDKGMDFMQSSNNFGTFLDTDFE